VARIPEPGRGSLSIRNPYLFQRFLDLHRLLQQSLNAHVRNFLIIHRGAVTGAQQDRELRPHGQAAAGQLEAGHAGHGLVGNEQIERGG
jgi:hypothetical protein